ncbi:MAG: response regulator [Actinomycetes bacterium]|jgi:CheY-like chemotaxis protein
MATILIAADVPALRAEVASVLAGPEVEILEAASGPEVISTVNAEDIDLLVIDMQIGSMGGFATALELRHAESYGKLEHIPVLMLLDRRPDVFLAKRSGAEGWLVKPLDALRLRRATRSLLDGGNYEDSSFTPAEVSSHGVLTTR